MATAERVTSIWASSSDQHIVVGVDPYAAVVKPIPKVVIIVHRTDRADDVIVQPIPAEGSALPETPLTAAVVWPQGAMSECCPGTRWRSQSGDERNREHKAQMTENSHGTFFPFLDWTISSSKATA